MSVTTQTAIEMQCSQCDKQVHLRGQLAQAIKSLVKAHASHYTARAIGDPEVHNLNAKLETADAEWKLAQQSYLTHRREHGC